jgi:hypothetical protein
MTQSDAPEEKARKDAEENVRIFLPAASELLFVLLPFIVIGIALAHRGEIRTIFFIPEWSIVSAVIAGQAIVRVASASIGTTVVKPKIILIISILLVCLLVPILSILAIALTSPSVSTSLAVTQSVFFLLSLVVYFFSSAFESYSAEKWGGTPGAQSKTPTT